MKWTEELRRILQRLRGEIPTEQAPGDIDCHEALERIFDWLDSELDPTEAASVGEHLETCARCYPLLSFERAFREAIQRAPHQELAAVDLQRRIVDALEKEGLISD